MEPVRVFGTGKNLRVSTRTAAKVDDAAGKIATKLRTISVVAVQEHDPVCGKRLDQLELGACNACLAIGKVLNVRGANIGDDAPVGHGDARQRGNLARVVHAHLDHGKFVLRHQAQQLQGQAKAVVQVALRFENAKFCAERRSNGFLGGGFSRRARDGNDAASPLAAHMVGQHLHRSERVFGDEKRMGERGIGQGSGTRARNDSGHGAAFERRDQKVVPVVMLATNSKKKLIGCNGARVDGVSGRNQRARILHAGRRLEHCSCAHHCFCKREIHCPSR